MSDTRTKIEKLQAVASDPAATPEERQTARNLMTRLCATRRTDPPIATESPPNKPAQAPPYRYSWHPVMVVIPKPIGWYTSCTESQFSSSVA